MDHREQDTTACKTHRIQFLNDEFRTTGEGGTIVITEGVQRLGVRKHSVIMQAIRAFDQFTSSNDPYGEHDFGAVDIGEANVFWKIDYHDVDKLMGSPDPADASVTARVMTVMLDSDY